MANSTSRNTLSIAGSDLMPEAIRRGVQYLAFRLTDQGLVASYQPGAATAPVLVSRAALAAVAADTALAQAAQGALSPGERRARQDRAALAEQLAQVRQRRPEALRIARRERYLAALAEMMIAQSARPVPIAAAVKALPGPEVARRRASL